jgi:two-component system LytT family response regulator
MNEPQKQSVLDVKRQKLGKLSIPTMEGYMLILLSEILYLESDNTYTVFHLEDSTILVSTKNIGFYELELLEEPFLRVHNSYMVNFTKVSKYVRADDGYLILHNKKAIKVSRNRKDEMLNFFRNVKS